MESLNNTNMKERERELANSFSDRFRRMWIDYTRFGGVVITAFPLGLGNYQMFFAKGVQDFSLENLRKIVLKNITPVA